MSDPALLTALADNTLDEIVVANGTYHVRPAGTGSDSPWIGVGAQVVARSRSGLDPRRRD